MKAAHSHAPIRTSTVTSQMVAMGGRPSITPSSTATRTMAVSTRCLSTAGRSAHLFAGQAEATFARGEGSQCRLEVRHVEIGPQRLADVQLGVGQIPQQEIADAVIATGADEQIRIADLRERELARETLLVDLLGTQRTARDLRRQAPRGLQDVPAAAVAHRH